MLIGAPEIRTAESAIQIALIYKTHVHFQRKWGIRTRLNYYNHARNFYVSRSLSNNTLTHGTVTNDADDVGLHE